ncbi:hypothetical protein FB451DRAFT_1450718 [Mycena latifolia]|nr:hypothetical protein FB451DRAFT_1450718 [Mycena latifolia]
MSLLPVIYALLHPTKIPAPEHLDALHHQTAAQGYREQLSGLDIPYRYNSGVSHYCLLTFLVKTDILASSMLSELADGAGGSLTDLAALVVRHIDRLVGSGDMRPTSDSTRLLKGVFVWVALSGAQVGINHESEHSLRRLFGDMLEEGLLESLVGAVCALSRTTETDPLNTINKGLFLLRRVLRRIPLLLSCTLHARLLRATILCGQCPSLIRTHDYLKSFLTEVLPASMVHCHMLPYLDTALSNVRDLASAEGFTSSAIFDDWRLFVDYAEDRLELLEAFDSRMLGSMKAATNFRKRQTSSGGLGAGASIIVPRNVKPPIGKTGAIGRRVRRTTPSVSVDTGQALTARERSFMRALLYHEFDDNKIDIYWDTHHSASAGGEIEYDILCKTGAEWADTVARAARSGGRMTIHVMRVRKGSMATDWVIPLRTNDPVVHNGLKGIAASLKVDAYLEDVTQHENVLHHNSRHSTRRKLIAGRTAERFSILLNRPEDGERPYEFSHGRICIIRIAVEKASIKVQGLTRKKTIQNEDAEAMKGLGEHLDPACTSEPLKKKEGGRLSGNWKRKAREITSELCDASLPVVQRFHIRLNRASKVNSHLPNALLLRKRKINTDVVLNVLPRGPYSAVVEIHNQSLGVGATKIIESVPEGIALICGDNSNQQPPVFGGLEHRLAFSLEHQKTISLLITATATTFGTIYSTVLVFVAQTLSLRRRLQMEQPLTAIHDSAAAWSELGSAVLRIWHQKALPASVIGVLSALLYLGNILVLHITTPALFSVETFNSSRLVPVGTYGLPAYNWSTYNLSNHDDLMSNRSNLSDYVLGSTLSFQSTVWSTERLGLSGGTLYDVLDINSGVGNDLTSHAGTPGKWACTSSRSTDDSALRLEGVNFTYYINPTQPEIISTPIGWLFPQDYILLYSTIPIVDSNNDMGPMVNLSRPMGNSVSAIQILQCSQTLVSQTAVVDSQIRQILSVDKTIEKSDSVWHPYTLHLARTAHLSQPEIYSSTRKRALSCGRIDVLDKQACITVLYNYDTQSVILVGNIPPSHGPLVAQFTKGNISGYGFEPVINPPFLLQGNATVTQVSVQGRLDVAAGLVASVTLFLLSLSFSLGGAHEDKEIQMDGTGILHAIWLYRSHPELERLMPHVENPTDNNLREAGMVRTKLIEGGLRKDESWGSF